MSRLLKPISPLLVGVALLVLPTLASAEATPEGAFRTFVERVQSGDVDAAWALLSERTRTQLEALVRSRSAESGGAIPSDPKQAILGSASLARSIDRIDRKKDGKDAVTLLVVSGEEEQEVRMVREGNGWRVDLVP